MRTHPVVGFSLLKEVPALEPYLPFVLRHHERVDGSGYPDGLLGPEIPLAVQLVSLSDAYDAMTSSRPYRPVRDDRETIRILEEEAGRGGGTRAPPDPRRRRRGARRPGGTSEATGLACGDL